MPNLKNFSEKGSLPFYFRIGTNFYKRICVPMADGSEQERLVSWSADAIRQDEGKDAINDSDVVKKLDAFVLIPSHFNYQRIVNGRYYNKYAPLPYLPLDGTLPQLSLYFMSHIFSEQLDLGLDYIKILLENPLQMLPILCIVSRERATGKSTFLNWLKSIFGDNMTINSNEKFASNFNSDWATKLLIGTEETLLNRREDSERFKNLSTAKFSKIESKGVDRQEIEFFGKFILCSNNEDSFIYLDDDEIRYWVRKVPPLDFSDPSFLDKLIAEIPSFLYYLQQRPFSTAKKTRMWFTPKQLQTDALRKLKSANKDRVETALAEALLTIIDNLPPDQTELEFCLLDAKAYLKQSGFHKLDGSRISKVLKEKWGLKSECNSKAYTKWLFFSDGRVDHIAGKGRYFTIDLKTLQKHGFSDAADAELITI